MLCKCYFCNINYKYKNSFSCTFSVSLSLECGATYLPTTVNALLLFLFAWTLGSRGTPPHAHTHFPKQRAFFGSLCFCHVLSVSDFRILIKSCCIESRIQFKEFPTQHMSGWHSCISIRLLNQWWSVTSWIPTGDNFYFLLLRCRFCTKNSEMSELCYFRKPLVGRYEW